MYDVIGTYERLKRIYQLYIKSTFPLRYQALVRERDTLLEKPLVLSQPPLIEPVPIYPSSGMTLTEIVNHLLGEYQDLSQLGQAVFSADTPLYEHQKRSIEEVLINQKDIVVTTGTGSGKTECFLLPLIAQLARESRMWKSNQLIPENHAWWNENDNSNRLSQWGHTPRPKAMRAIILYPLNALVEDQLRRLRKAFDSPEVHQWLDTNRGGNRITFGRYTGQTHVSGLETPESLERLRQELRERDLESRSVQDKANTDLPYYFPRLDGGEMWSRWDMQDTPPDVLITNYSMLNIMLMRSIEDNIFEITREWLAEPDYPERQFYLIIDELHAYRGTPGTEVAYILRLLYSRLGLTSDSPKLRILTTTASLDPEQGKDFLREFFGRDNFEFIREEQIPPQENARTSLHSPAIQTAFANFAQSIQADPCNPLKPADDANGETVQNAITN